MIYADQIKIMTELIIFKNNIFTDLIYLIFKFKIYGNMYHTFYIILL